MSSSKSYSGIISSLPSLRNGKEYMSSTIIPLKGINEQVITNISLSPEMHIQLAIPINKGAGFTKLSKLKIDELIDIYVEAGKIFSHYLDVSEVSTSLEDWAKMITLATGMPISYVRNSLSMVSSFFQRSELQRFLEANSPTGELAIYDELVGVRGSTIFSFAPRGKNVGVALPGNHPAVALFGAIIPLFKIPTILRSSTSEPFTSYRISKSLWDAGLPPEALFHFVTTHSEVDTLITKSDLGIIFGSDWTVKKYGNKNNIKVYGPGRSKVLVDIENMNNYRMKQALDISYQSIMYDGGRGCINASGIVYNSKEDYDEFKRKLAKRLAKIEPYNPLEDEALLPAMKKEDAKILVEYIRKRMNGQERNLTAEIRGEEDILRIDGEYGYLLPTLLELDEEHPMRTDEYPFPFGTVVKPNDYYAHELVKNSLALSLITDDKQKARQYLLDPTIEKVFVNDSSFLIDLAAPHEGFMSDFLYKTKATNKK